MSTQNPITLHLSLDELILIETVLEEHAPFAGGPATVVARSPAPYWTGEQ